MYIKMYLWKMFFFSAWSPTGHAKYSSLPEVVIPLRVNVSSRNNISRAWLSYSLHIRGQRHIITMKPKKNLISRNFLLLTYSDQGDPLEEQPFVQNDCYYHGYVDEDPESLVIVHTCFGSLQGILDINGTTYEIMPKSSTSTFEHLAYELDSEESESIPMRCGLTEDEIARQMKLQERVASTLLQIPYENWWTHHRFIDYFVVIDHKRYVYRNNNTTTCLQDMLQIVNGINGYYLQISMDVVLTKLEVWTEQNHINVEQSISNVLRDFSDWKRASVGNEIRYDVIHLFARHGYGISLGLAYVATVCLTLNCAVISFVSDDMLDIAFVVAHEMGHNLGLIHDVKDCYCGRKTCLMAAYKSNSPKFSNCSFEYLYSFLFPRTCLYDTPETLETLVTTNLTECGNNLVEEGEQCDCGSSESCSKDPCCSEDCVLKPGAQCASGLCCQHCQFLQTGSVCRKEKNECDLPEWCNGTSAECPTDVYKEVGSPCSGGGYCYKMECHQHDEQCRKIFGNGSRSASGICYMEMNKRGDRFGNCGIDAHKYIGCKLANVHCGRIQCENVTVLPQRRNHETLHSTHFSNITCWTIDYHFGITLDDIGAVNDGTVCGPQHLCIDRKCVHQSILSSNCSTIVCHMHGVCNNKQHCHCDLTWEPPDCQLHGHGGSIDSGPAPVPLSPSNWSMYFIAFLLMCVLGLISLYVLFKLRILPLKKVVPNTESGDRHLT
ncbi:disintegrin and metalloproteinase domain-containing protein 26A-like isoform X2 [Grammomys surdaster]|uniref:disintegrin and metalloproteinase domain-containing protein 26A-like isoform X2 n=1 Tax=Grammomys surdaster TaxID=491861 RepID=UPI0010A03DD9|nr:disintegrin and metalloproteinase domain-containing protein 26A-like isoform X2 [Grammomys surdaster]